MNKTIQTLLILALSFNLACQTKNEMIDFNLDFEAATTGDGFPKDWFMWGSGYKICVDSLIYHQGNKSAAIEPLNLNTGSSFGSIATDIPAIYAGREIELRAWMKFQDVKDGFVGLLLRIDGSAGSLAFDNMQDKSIQGTSDWKMYTIKLPYSEKAKTIYLGAIHKGKGKLWVDDFELLIDGKDFRQAKIKEIKEFNAAKDKEFDKGSKIEYIELTKSKINDLKTFGLIWGFLKYYHPNIAAGNYNWDYELFRILPQLLATKNQSERDKLIVGQIKNLGEFRTGEVENIKDEIKINPDLDWIKNSKLSADLSSLLVQVQNAKRSENHHYIDLLAGVGNPEFKNENEYADMSYPDAGFRLLALYRYWNIIQYYFPYKNLIEEDWKGVLEEFIPKFIEAKDEVAYKLALLELIGRVHDTHANIWKVDKALDNHWGINYAPFEVTFIEGKPVVTDFYKEEPCLISSIKIGDVITKINQRPFDEIVKERLKYTPASNYPTKLRDIARKLLRTNNATMDIEFERNGKSELKSIPAYSPDSINIYKKYMLKDTCFRLIEPGIAYIYPGSIKNTYIPDMMEKIKDTKGLIIDLRCYPSEFIVFSLSHYLMPKNAAFVKFTNGSLKNPGLFTFTKEIAVGQDNKDYYKGKVVILINETTQSQAEYTTMAFRVAPNATVIGSTTAGADGNVSAFYLPGGMRTMISGIGVYYPDGRETQRVGIVPDIEVKPTIKGIMNMKDEVLDKAIEMINHQ